MKLFIILAIRNVHRHLRLSLLNGIGITFSVIILLFILSLSRGIESHIVTRNIMFETGALTISFSKEIASFQNKSAGDSLFSDISDILDNNNKIKNYSFRIYPSQSLLYLGENIERIKIKGIADSEVSVLKEMLLITQGDKNLLDGKSILISNGLIKNDYLLDNDNSNILQQTIDGTINLDEFAISGVFRYTSQANKYDVYMNYDHAKILYNCNLPSKLLINLYDIKDVDAVEKSIRGCLEQRKTKDSEDKKDIEYGGVKISSFKDYLGTARSLSKINKFSMLGIAFFLILISFIGIWSMQVENINERKQEIGTLLSFGFSIRNVQKIFLYESLYISLLFAGIGSIILIIVVIVININKGIYLGDSASFAFGSAIVDPKLTFQDFLATILVAILYPLLATKISLRVLSKHKLIQLLNEE